MNPLDAGLSTLDALRSLFVALFVTHRSGGFANECLFFKTRCSLCDWARSCGGAGAKEKSYEEKAG
jgi:hypothetical protein